ncbi:MAG: EAL and HDOD domain-containing protein, partial [bacterium]
FKPEFENLLEWVDIIKVDFLSTNAQDCRAIFQKVDSGRIKFLAEKVETREVFEQARELGYYFFQGNFFAEPVIVAGRSLPAHKMNFLRLLQQVNRPDLDYNELEKIFKEDVTLSYKLLRYINSAYFGFSNKIRSIRHALTLLGLFEAKKWLSLIALNSMGQDKSEEVVISSLFRANLCELLAPLVGLEKRAPELFLMGLFSMLDALLDRPLDEVLAELPIAEDVKSALLGQQNILRDVYRLVVFYEKGDWEHVFKLVENLKSVEENLPELFVKTLQRANRILPA